MSFHKITPVKKNQKAAPKPAPKKPAAKKPAPKRPVGQQGR
ncbi:hypothetical protein [Streptomyces sp. NBC_00038]|nr:hypothetical protein [Streptomyces sp. NBC_00038]MCX5558776.1 hypothetical protein [Streptomyces sp. NBC_00038]